jgi:hypothetical protein
MEENKSKSNQNSEKDPGKKATIAVDKNQQGGFPFLHEVDQQEGSMNNGALGGNFENSPEVRDSEKER